MVEDTLNLIAHSIWEIKFYISFISGTFLIRFTVYEILRVFWKIAFEKTQVLCTTGLFWKYVYLNKQFRKQCVCKGI